MSNLTREDIDKILDRHPSANINVRTYQPSHFETIIEHPIGSGLVLTVASASIATLIKAYNGRKCCYPYCASGKTLKP